MNVCKPQLCYGLSVLGALVRGSGDGREGKTTRQTDEPDRSSVWVFHQFTWWDTGLCYELVGHRSVFQSLCPVSVDGYRTNRD